MSELVIERVLEIMTDEERERAAVVESVLPVLRENAAQADAEGKFPEANAKAIADSGLLGLVVPKEYGGMGGTLRDLTATTYAFGTACPSTALAYFFHNSSSSRGMLPLGAIDAGLYTDEEIPDRPRLRREGAPLHGHREASGSATSRPRPSRPRPRTSSSRPRPARSTAAGSSTAPSRFGCLSTTADYYMVTAKLEGVDGLDGLALFLVDRRGEGVGSAHAVVRPGHARLGQQRLRPRGRVRPRRHGAHPRRRLPARDEGRPRHVGRQPGRDRVDLRRQRPRHVRVRARQDDDR